MIFALLRVSAACSAIALLFMPELLVAHSQGQRPLSVLLSAESIGPGDLFRIDVIADASERISATFLAETLMFGFDNQRGTWTALAGVDLETQPGSYVLEIARDNSGVMTRTIHVVPKSFRIRRLRVPDGFVNPSADAVDQIARDVATLADTYARSTPPRWTGAFVLPVDGTPTSNFGVRSYYNGVRRAPHAGVDFVAEPGTPIRATNHGTVALAAPLYFTGNTIVIDHGARLFSIFAHLSEFHVKPGDVVMPETVVGLVGATGRATGPHLHWGVRLNGARVDPLSLIAITR
jgi:murein DD-endopeptidase MepM/ murein hydrolase activator NlpD